MDRLVVRGGGLPHEAVLFRSIEAYFPIRVLYSTEQWQHSPSVAPVLYA